MTSLFRTGVLGSFLVACATGTFWVALSACESLSQTSPLPSPDSSDLDAGQPPEESTSSSSTSGAVAVDAGPPPNSARVRFANFIRGPEAVDLCSKPNVATAPWSTGRITSNPLGGDSSKGDGLFFGQVSASWFELVNVVGSTGQTYLFRVVPVGTDCNEAGSPVLAQTAAAGIALRQGAGITLLGVGRLEDGVDAGDGTARLNSIADNLAPPSNATLFRVIHGVPDVAAFDVVINGETVLTGVKYGNGIQFPYTSTNGFASINAGIAEDAPMLLRSGTTVRSFTIPRRLRRGIASTVFTGGSKDDLTVTLCSDRFSEDSNGLANCERLPAQD